MLRRDVSGHVERATPGFVVGTGTRLRCGESAVPPVALEGQPQDEREQAIGRMDESAFREERHDDQGRDEEQCTRIDNGTKTRLSPTLIDYRFDDITKQMASHHGLG